MIFIILLISIIVLSLSLSFQNGELNSFIIPHKELPLVSGSIRCLSLDLDWLHMSLSTSDYQAPITLPLFSITKHNDFS